MNKAFLREPDPSGEFCPRCHAAGEAVVLETLRSHLSAEQLTRIAATANFCPTPTCAVAYFDVFERVILASELAAPVYPKDPEAPLCACFGLTRDDVAADIEEGGVRRVRAAVERARSAEAACATKAANGRSCVAYIQRCYLRMKEQAGE